MRHFNITNIAIKESISNGEERLIAADLIRFVERELSLTGADEIIECSPAPLIDFLIFFYDKYENWDNWVEDFSHLAQTYPECTFVVDGDDGDGGKMWRTYFRGHKIFTADARIVYDTPDWYEED